MLRPTSTATPPPSEAGTGNSPLYSPEYDNASIAARWKEALEKCQNDLRAEEKKTASRFQRPEDLINDLNSRQQTMNNELISQLVIQLYPALYALKHLCVLFLASMPAGSVEMALFWGFLYLAINGCLSSRAALAKFVQVHNRIQRHLVEFGSLAQTIEDQPELRYASVDLFVTLIRLWNEVVNANRKTGAGNIMERTVTDALLGIKGKFDLALIDIEESVQRVERLASHSHLRFELDRRSQVNEDILAMMASQDDSLTKFPLYSLPPPLNFFFGRERELDMIWEHLKQPIESSHPLRTFVIYGLGGVGKTALALAFTNRCKAEDMFDAVLWISSETSADIRRSFSEIALRLELPRASQNMDNESNIMVVRNWLGKTSRTWLCIYDNVEDFKVLEKSRCLPPGNGCILITARSKHTSLSVPGTVERLELSSFDDDQSLQLFEGLWKSYDSSADLAAERTEAQHLLPQFGGLPLGIEQVAAYISYRSCTVRQFATRYAKMARSILSKSEGGRAPHTLATVWEVQFERISGSPASQLLGLLSLLSPDAVPKELLTLPSNENVETFDFCVDAELLEDAVDDLTNVALAKRTTDDQLVVHRLVQTAFIHSVQGFGQLGIEAHFNLAVRMVRKQFPVSGGDIPMWGRWDRCSKYYPHVLALASSYRTRKLDSQRLTCKDQLLDLWRDCIWYQYEIGDHVEAVDLLDLAYRICEDKDSLMYAYLRSHAGCIHYALNDMKSARESNLIALDIRKRKANPADRVEHIELSHSFSNTGMERYSEGFLEEAEALFEEGRKIRESYQGVEMYRAVCRGHLGQTHCASGNFNEAQNQFKIAEDDCLLAGESGDFVRAYTYYHWGNLELAKADVSSAQAYYRKAHDMWSKLAPTHMYSSSCYYKQGIVASRQGQLDIALANLDKAIVIAEYRKKDSAVARCLHQKARIVEASATASQVQRQKAVEWRLQAHTITLHLSSWNAEREWRPEHEKAYDHLVPGEER